MPPATARKGAVNRERKLEVLRSAAKAPRLVQPPVADTPATTIMEIGPDEAVALLERHAPNRVISDNRVQQFARDMVAGAWDLNGETVKFDRNGLLTDGQHRLWAIVESRVTVRTAVAYGLEPESIRTVDAGRPRSVADQLHMQGRSNSNLQAAVARLWCRYDTGTIAVDSRTVSYREVEAAFSRHPTIEEAVPLVHNRGSKNVLGNSTALAFTLSGALEGDRARALQWIELVRTGAGLSEQEPAYVLREKLLALRAATAKLRALDVVAICMKGWIAHVEGRPVQILAWRWSQGELFPRFPHDKKRGR